MYKKVPTTLNFVEREKETLKFWKDNQIFEKSVQLRQGAPAYTFFDGPPTAIGRPHIGHIETRAIKDLIPRGQTMTYGEIARRLSPYGRQKRPRLRGLDDAELVEFMSRDMAAREPFYAQAQQIVDCGELSDDEVVEPILRHTMQNE